jgi:DNA polymerase-3 subunit chi
LTASKVDFYLLSGSGEIARQQFACRLAEKAYKLEHTVHIHAGNPESAKKLDELLWTFRDGSFVPHEVMGHAPPEAPVTIGFGDMLPGDRHLLINLSDTVPSEAATFPRVAEIVAADEDSKSRSRQRFVDYRDQGHTLDTHKL